MFFIYSPDCNKLRLIYVIKDVVTVRIVGHYLTGDIMKYVKNIFLVLAFALSAAAFSTSVMAASDSKTPPGNTKSTPGGDLDISKIPNPFAHRPEWCNNWPSDQLKPLYFYQVCGFG